MTVDLFGDSRESLALALLRDLEPADGYWLAFSGGKDSVVIKHLCKKAGIKFDAHYALTTVDPPELVRFIREYHPDVIQDRPAVTMTELIVREKIPPTRRMRYCCEELKERGGRGRIVVTGIRAAESPRRAKRKIVESCWRSSGTTFVNPIIDWSDEDVWNYIRSEKISYCSLYDEGFERIGCIGCPMAGRHGRQKEFDRWPGMKSLYIRAFEKMLEARKTIKGPTTWSSGEDVFNWWMEYEKPYGYSEDDEQTIFDF